MTNWLWVFLVAFSLVGATLFFDLVLYLGGQTTVSQYVERHPYVGVAMILATVIFPVSLAGHFMKRIP